MPSFPSLSWLLPGVLLACVGEFGRAEETPKLPAQYAEVVLRVEGMI